MTFTDNMIIIYHIMGKSIVAKAQTCIHVL